MQSREIDRCDREIAHHLSEVLKHRYWYYALLGYYDWNIERKLIMEEFVQAALRTEPNKEDYTRAFTRLADPRTLRLLHVAMGLCTEAGEFLETIKKHIFYGKPLDLVNLKEEAGDATWYLRVGCDVLEMKLVELLESNVAKLKARYPDKFTETAAINRDVAAEMKAMGDDA
jgi:NTP pyrophosphatase (non-canonical NTP hydrolase)